MPTLPTSAAMHAVFGRAGFLAPCVWTPQPGGVPLPGQQVDYREPSIQVLDGEGAISAQPTAQWPRGQYPAARRGDRLDITHPTAGAVLAYAIREVHRIGSDGDEVLAELEAWPCP